MKTARWPTRARCIIYSLIGCGLWVIGFLHCIGETHKNDWNETRTNGIVKVFWHEDKEFSFMSEESVSDANKKSFVLTTRKFNGSDIRIIPDVPADEKMWVKEEKRWKNGYLILGITEMHVHGPQDIQGAGWDHGKLGKGNTVVIAE